MGMYDIEIKETISKVVSIEASSEREAILLAKEKYYLEDSNLKGDDYIDTDIAVYSEEKNLEPEYALVKGEFHTVRELIRMLKKLPRTFDIGLAGITDDEDIGYGLLVDINNKKVLIDTSEILEYMLDEQEDRLGRTAEVI